MKCSAALCSAEPNNKETFAFQIEVTQNASRPLHLSKDAGKVSYLDSL